MMIVDAIQMIVSTPRRLNFLCLVSFDGIPALYNCNTKVSSGSQMVTAKEGREGGELFLMRWRDFFFKTDAVADIHHNTDYECYYWCWWQQKRGEGGKLFLMRWRDSFLQEGCWSLLKWCWCWQCKRGERKRGAYSHEAERFFSLRLMLMLMLLRMFLILLLLRMLTKHKQKVARVYLAEHNWRSFIFLLYFVYGSVFVLFIFWFCLSDTFRLYIR